MNDDTKEIIIIAIWAIAITIIILGYIFMLAWILSPTAFTIEFKMDNNTLESVKSMNWSAINNINKYPSNYEPIDSTYKIDYNFENKSMPCWKYSHEEIWRCVPK